MQITSLQFQAKIDDLENQRREFDDLRRQVVVRTERYETFKNELKSFLEQRRQEALEFGLVGVRQQWETLTPKKTDQRVAEENDRRQAYRLGHPSVKWYALEKTYRHTQNTRYSR